MAITFNENLIAEIRKLLGSSSLEYFYSPEFGSANSNACSDWREKLQKQIDETLFGRNIESSYSVSHSNFLGGAALIDSAEGQVGFDIEQTARVLPAVALRVSDEEQMRLAPSPAALFVAKEAAFKSLRGSRQPKVLSEVEILEWSLQKYSFPLYIFAARLKGQQNQWLGVCFQDADHTVGISFFPHRLR